MVQPCAAGHCPERYRKVIRRLMPACVTRKDAEVRRSFPRPAKISPGVRGPRVLVEIARRRSAPIHDQLERVGDVPLVREHHRPTAVVVVDLVDVE